MLKIPQNSSIHVVRPGTKVDLNKVSTNSTAPYKSKGDEQEQLKELKAEMIELQERLYAESKQSLLIVLQAMDTGGKDGAIKNLLNSVDPAGVHITSFKAPTSAELAHDFLWRVHKAAPAKGFIGVWNRSHYEDVLVPLVRGWVEPETIVRRFRAINDFEHMLTENGTTIVKCFLHISKDEQKERLQARLDDPAKHWKFNTDDLHDRRLWDKFHEAYESLIAECSTDYAPWYIIPADKKWSRNIQLAELAVAALREMKPDFPKPTVDLKSIVID